MIRSVLVGLLLLFALVGGASAQGCSSYPNTLTNGTNADATQVMANFNYVANCVNSISTNIGTTNSTISNCALAASVISNNLTVALKANNGSDPSTSNPCIVSFRDSSAPAGDYIVASVTSATSIVLNSGSSLGASSGVAFRIWVELMYNGTTAVLAVSLQSTPTAIFALTEESLRSSTACNACTNATSAGTFFSTAALTSAPFRILGYLEWGNGLTTAGNWVTGPTKIQLFGPGINKPGEVVQTVVAIGVGTGSNSSLTPVNVTGGNVSIALTSAANLVKYSFFGQASVSAGGAGTNSQALVGIVRGATALTASALVGVVSGSGTNYQSEASATLTGYDKPNSVSSLTYGAQISNPNNNAAASFTKINISVDEIQG